MPAEAPSITTDILLLSKKAEEVGLIQRAAETNRISVVEECPDVLRFLRQQEGYIDAPRPDLILLDLDLSKTEDCEILTDIKKDPRFKRIPVVVLASSDRYEDVFQAYDLHANAYLCKPPSQEQLVTV